MDLQRFFCFMNDLLNIMYDPFARFYDFEYGYKEDDLTVTRMIIIVVSCVLSLKNSPEWSHYVFP